MRNFLIFIFLILLSTSVYAETINLKNGQTITGKILEKDAQSIKVDSNGMTMTYYMDEIKDIDGKSAEAPAPVKSVQPIKTPAVTDAKTSLEDPKEKRALIIKFIDVFGTRTVMAQNFDMMINALKEQKPQMASQFRERVKVDEIIEKLIPLYDKHFTSQELKTYIDFYSSPMGQKLITNISEIMKESIQVSAEYIKEKFPEAMKEE